MNSSHFPQKINFVKEEIAASGFNRLQSWFRKSEGLKLMNHFSKVRWRQTCLKMNPFSYTGDLEDGENSDSWLSGLGSLSRQKRVPNVQGTSQQENGAWENGHNSSKTYLMIYFGGMCGFNMCTDHPSIPYAHSRGVGIHKLRAESSLFHLRTCLRH